MLDKHPLCEQKHPLVVRTSDHGKFFGCLTFPEHKVIVTRPNCPDGHIMRLIDGPHGEFFGCEEYRTLDSKTTYNFEPKLTLWFALCTPCLSSIKISKFLPITICSLAEF